MKSDFPSLLPAGRHPLILQELDQIAVAAFPENERRRVMFSLFELWIERLTSVGVSGTLWVDGSFLTEKPDPGDIDCVLWHPTSAAPLSAIDQKYVENLIDRPSARATYGLDFFLEVCPEKETFHRQAYWMGILGFGHDRRTAKGFVEIKL